MGIWDTIKKGYNYVDKNVGGYLPGGQTPEQVKATNSQPTPTAQATLPTSQGSATTPSQSQAKPSGFKNVKDVFTAIAKGESISTNVGNANYNQNVPNSTINKLGDALIPTSKTDIALAGLPIGKAGSMVGKGIGTETIAQTLARTGPIVKKLEQTGQSILASKGLSIPNVAKVAGGKMIEIGSSTSKTKLTTKAAALVTNYMGKTLSAMNKPLWILGALTTSMFTANMIKNEEGDAIANLGFQLSAATKENDIEGAKAIYEMIADINDPMILQMLSDIPLIGEYSKSVDNKIKSVKDTADIAMTRMYERMAQENNQQAQRDEESAFYEAVAERNKMAKKEEREADAKYWQDIMDKKAERNAEERRLDEESAKRETEEYLKRQKAYQDSTPSKLKFGII